jgi:tetratricopeptide (TPR) repeat protein
VSPRVRTSLVVAALAVAAAIVVAGASMISSDERDSGAATTAGPKPRKGAPPLELSLGVRDDAEARDLRRAMQLYQAGRRTQAGTIFGRHGSLEAKVGAAFAAWPGSEDRIEQLGALYPRSALVQLHVGLARLWAGTGAAGDAWREARDVEPDTPYAVWADDFLHPELAPGLPVFTPSFPYRVEGGTPAAQLRALRADHSRRGLLIYGIALQRLGRPVSARRAFAAALRLGPNDVDALVADAIGHYEKSDPAGAFGRLGPLTRRFPGSASVRFHLGVLLLWQSDVQAAKRQLRLARAAEPGSRIAREAGRYLQELGKAGTG